MEKTFVYKNGKIKVTYNESSMLKDYDDKYVIREYRHRTKPIANLYSIEITIVKPNGGKIGYGMLGAMVQPADKQGVVNVSISYTNNNTVRFRDSIIGYDEYVFKGLPKEYLDAVEHSVIESLGDKKEYPQCNIDFAYAANCEVGSSSMIFSHIAGIIMDIIFENSVEEIFEMDIEEFTCKYVKSNGALHLKY